MHYSSYARLLLLGAIWGFSFLFMRMVAPVLGAVPTAFFRVLFASLGLIVILMVLRTRWQFQGKFRQTLLLGAINSGIPFLMYTFAARLLPAGYSAIFNATAPLMGVLIGALFFQEAISPRKLVGVITGLAGVTLLTAVGPVAIAAGVAKAKADVILISGNVGGTGASPQTSIKYAGGPWEMGLSEANQVLTLNNLRHSVRLRADGGMRTGRDVVIAAMLGAEEFGIGTASLIAMGCIMVRQCHSNTCPVGVCTQDEALREKFSGSPEKVINLFTFIAEEVREILAGLGFRSLNEIVGRTDLLQQVSRGGEHLDDLDLNPLLVRADPGHHAPFCTVEGRNEVPDTLDAQIVRDAAPLLERGEKMQLTYTVRNTARAIGSRTSSHIVRKFGMEGLPPGHLTVQLKGSAGQSLGAFAVQGLRVELTGEANDYVGKGLSGATLIVRPAPQLASPQTNAIIGNTVLYGATSGRLFAAGLAGERFGVRNSGAVTVVEGCGTNGLEYMTGGVAVVLGPVGFNFAAGMTGGMAYVLDLDDRFLTMLNRDSVVVERIGTRHWEAELKALVEEHARETGSALAQTILRDWDRCLPKFWQVVPKEMVHRLDKPLAEEEAVHHRA